MECTRGKPGLEVGVITENDMIGQLVLDLFQAFEVFGHEDPRKYLVPHDTWFLLVKI